MSKPPKAPVEKKQEEEADFQEDAEAGQEGAARRQIDACIDRCRDLYRSPLISDATRQVYEDQVISFMKTQATVEQAAQNVQWAMDTLVKAAHARERFEARLEKAVGSGWISGESARRWMARFYDPHVIEWEREKWLTDVFPGYCERWKEVAVARSRALERAELFELDASDEPGLGVLQDRDAFLALDYDHRKELVARVDALIIAASTRKREIYRSVRESLAAAARGSDACLHTSQVGMWLKEALSSEDPRAYLEGVIMPALRRRTVLRSRYDALQESLRDGAPDGLRTPSLPQFLKWSEDQCSSFLAEAGARVSAAQRERLGERLAIDAGKKAVRASMDTGDWDGADAALTALEAEHPDDPEMGVMRRYLTAHRPDGTEREDSAVPAVLDQMRAIVRHVPSSMQGLYAASLSRGASSFARMMDHMHMAVWRADQAANPIPLMPEPETAEAPEPIAMARVDAEGEKGDAADAGAPAVLAMADGADARQTVELLEREDARAHGSRYNGLVSESVTLTQQRYLVDHVNARLMQDLRTLESRGVRFEMAA